MRTRITKSRSYHPAQAAVPVEVKFETAIILLATIGFTLVLYYSFELAISPTFSYGGEVFHLTSIANLLTAIFLALVLALTCPRTITGSGDFIIDILVYMLGIPAVLMPTIMAIRGLRQPLEMSLIAFLSFLLLLVGYNLLRRREPRPAIAQVDTATVHAGLILVLLTITILTYAMLQVFVGITLKPTSFGDLYSARSDSSALVRAAGPVLSYAIPIQLKAVNPALIAIGATKRKYILLAAVGVIGEYIGYTTLNQKQSLFAAGAIVVIAVALRRRRSLSQAAVAIGAVTVCLVSSALDTMTHRVFWTEVITDRLFMWPGFLPGEYFATFQVAPFNLWSDSLLRMFIPNQLPGWTPETLVGAHLTGNTGVFANASFLGDGYANLGLAGILLEGLVVLAILLTFQRYGRAIPLNITLPLCVMPAISLANGSAFTALVSGGVLPTLLIFRAIHPKKADRRNEAIEQDRQRHTAHRRPHISRSLTGGARGD